MKKLLFVILIVVVCLGLTVPVLAHSAPGPCGHNDEPGNSGYAQHHILAATADGNHVPGGHGGYSACLGTGRNSHQPDVPVQPDANTPTADSE